MQVFLIRRTLGFLATLVAVSAIVFTVMNVLPGDPAVTILGIDSTEDARGALRAQLGLDRPVWVRFLDWVWGAVRGDFGTSHFFRVPVADLIAERLPLTLSLAGFGMLATVIVGITFGMLAAAWRGGPGDWAVMLASQLGIAVPAFWLSILLVLLFAVTLRWLPPGGFPGWDDPVAALRALVLPVTALALVQSAVLARVTRASALEVMELEFVRTARAMGYAPTRVLRGHVLPNALVPIVTIVGMQAAGVVTGAIVIENVFYLPGLGRLLFQSIANRDLFTVQALVVMFAAIVVTANFLVDIAYALIDPRLKARL
jgi:peptide/nickel transport system permease protein